MTVTVSRLRLRTPMVIRCYDNVQRGINVYIGSEAKVLGLIKVGGDVAIGFNFVVIRGIG